MVAQIGNDTMTKITFLSLFLVGLIGSLHAARERETFLKGNKLMREGNVQEALKEYTEITHKGPTLWYNIGVCNYQQENFLTALIAFRHAERGASSNNLKCIMNAVEQVQNKLGQPHDTTTIVRLKKYSSYFSLFWLQILCIALWWLSLGVMWNRKKYKPIFMLVLWILFLWSLFTVISVWWVNSRNYGIVLNESSLFTGTSTEFHEVGKVAKADQVTIKNQNDGWYKVKADKVTGWIPVSNVEHIE